MCEKKNSVKLEVIDDTFLQSWRRKDVVITFGRAALNLFFGKDDTGIKAVRVINQYYPW